jgi:hypothetical protein
VNSLAENIQKLAEPSIEEQEFEIKIYEDRISEYQDPNPSDIFELQLATNKCLKLKSIAKEINEVKSYAMTNL